MEDDEPKAKSKSVSFQPELWEKVEAKASSKYGGNRSAYLRELVERDLAGGSIATNDPGIIVALARQYGYYFADELADLLRNPSESPELPIDQGIVLKRFFEALRTAMKTGLIEPEMSFELTPRKEWLKAVMKEVQDSYREAMAAEETAKYVGGPPAPKRLPKARVRLGGEEKSRAG